MRNRRLSSGVGLERSCAEAARDWLRSSGPESGVEFLEAWFQGRAYRKHRHDTYAICQTTRGVQAFEYRGSHEVSLPGQIVVLHPDELHDGYAATEAGFGYRQLYIDPALIFEAARTLRGRPGPLPFVRQPVLLSDTLADAIDCAFKSEREPLAIDSLVVQVAEGLLEADASEYSIADRTRFNGAALQRARQFLDAEKNRVVRSPELEAITGLSRYELARQFRLFYGTSPYRYLLMRRLDDVRVWIVRGRPLSEVAFEAGFADQAHFSRTFKAAFGLTPTRYRALHGLSRRDARD
jgi:AraC-like DNA-binding protein